MIQQINLYQDSLKQHRTSATGINTYIYGLCAIIVLLASYSIYMAIELNNTDAYIEQSRQQLKVAENKIVLLQLKYPKQEINQILSQELQRTQNIVDSLSQVINLLEDKTSAQTQGVSRYLSAFARQNTAEVWLRHININAREHIIDIEGSSYQAEKIAVFLQKLDNEAVFQGHSFARLEMKQNEENDQQIDFVINTTDETKKRKQP